MYRWFLSLPLYVQVAGVVFFLLILLKVHVVRQMGVCRSHRRLDGQTVIVTGSNTGIGKETAADLAGRGARVIMACRNLTKAKAAADDIRRRTGSSEVLVRHLDLSSLQSVRKFVAEFKEKEKRLDVLINNAAVFWEPSRRLTVDGLELQMATNHFGPFLLTNLLTDLLKRSAPSRIVNVSSIGHKTSEMRFDNLNGERDYSPLWAYSCSKLANVLMTRTLARRLEGTGVTANCLHPGCIYTNIAVNAPWYVTVPAYLTSLFYWKTPEQGAQTSIHVAVSEDVENVSGKYFADCKIVADTTELADQATADKLWEISERLTGLSNKEKFL